MVVVSREMFGRHFVLLCCFLFRGGVVAGEAGEAVQREAKQIGMLLSLHNHFLFCHLLAV